MLGVAHNEILLLFIWAWKHFKTSLAKCFFVKGFRTYDNPSALLLNYITVRDLDHDKKLKLSTLIKPFRGRAAFEKDFDWSTCFFSLNKANCSYL